VSPTSSAAAAAGRQAGILFPSFAYETVTHGTQQLEMKVLKSLDNLAPKQIAAL